MSNDSDVMREDFERWADDNGVVLYKSSTGHAPSIIGYGSEGGQVGWKAWQAAAKHYSTASAPVDEAVYNPRFFIDHGMIHDRVTGRHVTTDEETGIYQPANINGTLALLSELSQPCSKCAAEEGQKRARKSLEGLMFNDSSKRPYLHPAAQHSDDIAADIFAVAMKTKLAKKRAEGRGGWDNPAECSVELLADLLVGHIAKGDPVDIGNLAMMLFHRKGGDALKQRAAEVDKRDGWLPIESAPINTPVEIYDGKIICVASWSWLHGADSRRIKAGNPNEKNWGCIGTSGWETENDFDAPTHWRKLPTPPAKGE